VVTASASSNRKDLWRVKGRIKLHQGAVVIGTDFESGSEVDAM